MSIKHQNRSPLLTRRSLLKGTAGLSTVSAAPGLFRPLFARASRGMEIGVIAASYCASPCHMAALPGRFKDAGLNIELKAYPDMKGAVKDLLSGGTQAAQLTMLLFLALMAGEAMA